MTVPRRLPRSTAGAGSSAPAVLGWRRLTAGIGDGGELVLALRYDTEAAARRDRDRPELAAWQAAADRHLSGPAAGTTARSCTR